MDPVLDARLVDELEVRGRHAAYGKHNTRLSRKHYRAALVELAIDDRDKARLLVGHRAQERRLRLRLIVVVAEATERLARGARLELRPVLAATALGQARPAHTERRTSCARRRRRSVQCCLASRHPQRPLPA